MPSNQKKAPMRAYLAEGVRPHTWGPPDDLYAMALLHKGAPAHMGATGNDDIQHGPRHRCARTHGGHRPTLSCVILTRAGAPAHTGAT